MLMHYPHFEKRSQVWTSLSTHTSAVGTTDINCRWAQLSLAHCPPGGNLKFVTIPCRSTNSSDMTTAASYLGIFEEDTSGNFVHLATSVNTVAQKVGQDSIWQFEETVLPSPPLTGMQQGSA